MRCVLGRHSHTLAFKGHLLCVFQAGLLVQANSLDTLAKFPLALAL